MKLFLHNLFVSGAFVSAVILTVLLMVGIFFFILFAVQQNTILGALVGVVIVILAMSIVTTAVGDRL